jgi:hypothetical protein
MTPQEALFRVGVISALTYDNEVAHSLEDELYYDIIKLVADIESKEEFTFFDLAELVQVAKAALRTKEFSFTRWYA